MQSSARIRVTKDTEGDDTIVKIFGDDEQISKAKELIDALTEDRPRGPPVVATKVYNEPPRPASNSEGQAEPYNWFKYLKECVSFCLGFKENC